MRRAVVLAAGVFFACVGAAQASPPIRITTRGVAGVRPGMTFAQVKQRLGVTFAGEKIRNDLGGAVCRGSALQGEAWFTFHAGLARLDGIAFTSGVTTPEGIRPGSTLTQLRRAYGRRLVLDNDPDIHEADSDFVRGSGRHAFDLVFTVDTDTHRVLAIGLKDGGLVAVRCPTASPPPATIGVVSLAGASGLMPVMPQEQVLATWPWFPVLTDAFGSGDFSWMPVCAASARGLMQFGGGALANVWFTSGASTDTGITISSTLDELRQTYGAALTHGPGSDEYEVSAPVGPPTATLGFHIRNGLVMAIGFGGVQSIGDPRPVGTVWC